MGIEDTYNWFFEENRIPAVGQSRPVDAINRLGDYLRNLRFLMYHLNVQLAFSH